MNRKCLAATLAAVVALLLAVTGSAAAQQPKFQSSQETGGAPGRYRVQIELRPGDDHAAISGQLAATYGARIEPYAEEGFIGFAIMATPTRAKLMSNDPRVIAITDLNPVPSVDPPHQTRPVVQRQTLAAVAEQVRMVLTSEAVPGLGNYSYDGSGNITSIDNHVFRYDAFGRLQNAFLGSFGSQAYTYDRYGNILKIVTNGDDANAARMGVDPETNQMDLQSGGSNPANMIATYDGVGNVITHNGSFVYDVLGMMKETTDTNRRIHVYSASDERVVVIQVSNGLESTSEWTLRDGAHRVLRRLTKDSAGVWQWKEDYVYGESHLLAAEVPGPERVRHFHVDHLGTPRLITGNGGVRIAEKTYTPFGRKVSAVTADFEQLEFTAHERDTPSLDYMHARYYQPDLGRFLSVDPKERRMPLSNPQMWNRYAYALNSPLNFVDLDGEDVTPIRVLMKGGKAKIGYVDSRMVPRLQSMVTTAHKKGVSFTFSSLLRTQAEQDAIKTGNTRNNKGTSPHTAGLAVDINVKSSLKGTDLPGLTKIARGADLSPLSNQALDPPHFQANDLITRGDDGKVDDQFKALVTTNQQQMQDYEKLRLEDPEKFEAEVVTILPPTP